jgi:hypothetical protein
MCVEISETHENQDDFRLKIEQLKVCPVQEGISKAARVDRSDASRQSEDVGRDDAVVWYVFPASAYKMSWSFC